MIELNILDYYHIENEIKILNTFEGGDNGGY